MSFEIRISQSAIRNCVALALLTVAPVAGATGALDSVFTIQIDKKVFQMGDDVGLTTIVTNSTPDTIIFGAGFDAEILIKKKAYGPSLMLKGDPKPPPKWLNTEYVDTVCINRGKKLPPGFRFSFHRVFNYGDLPLNPGVYTLQHYVSGGPPPWGGWWSNVVEFEVLEPKGTEGEAWRMLSDDERKITPILDSLDKVLVQIYRQPSVDGAETVKLNIQKNDVQAGSYRKVLKEYPQTFCAQFLVERLKEKYHYKISFYTGSWRFDKAEEEVLKIVPDSLRSYFQSYIEQDKKETIKKWGPAYFDKSVKQAIERDSIREEERKQQQGKGVK